VSSIVNLETNKVKISSNESALFQECFVDPNEKRLLIDAKVFL